jgi:MerR family copper efflux transcriptional regulator
MTPMFCPTPRDLGFQVEAIGELLALWRDRTMSRHSADVKHPLAQAQIAGLRRKINEMESMVATLDHLAQGCSGDDRPDCPILADLEGEASLVAPACHSGPGFNR